MFTSKFDLYFEQQERDELAVAVDGADVGEVRAQRVVVDERVRAEDLEGRAVRVDAAVHDHPDATNTTTIRNYANAHDA